MTTSVALQAKPRRTPQITSAGPCIDSTVLTPIAKTIPHAIHSTKAIHRNHHLKSPFKPIPSTHSGLCTDSHQRLWVGNQPTYVLTEPRILNNAVCQRSQTSEIVFSENVVLYPSRIGIDVAQNGIVICQGCFRVDFPSIQPDGSNDLSDRRSGGCVLRGPAPRS